jgi:hypothetical protein
MMSAYDWFILAGLVACGSACLVIGIGAATRDWRRARSAQPPAAARLTGDPR